MVLPLLKLIKRTDRRIVVIKRNYVAKEYLVIFTMI